MAQRIGLPLILTVAPKPNRTLPKFNQLFCGLHSLQILQKSANIFWVTRCANN